jgi:hypothetical protein
MPRAHWWTLTLLSPKCGLKRPDQVFVHYGIGSLGSPLAIAVTARDVTGHPPARR